MAGQPSIVPPRCLMKILVPVKRVPDPFAKLKVLPDGSGIDFTGVKFEINPFDEIAMEEAVRLKEKNPSVDITTVSIGPAECEEQLRKALAIGADRALHVETNDPMDSSVVAAELAAIAGDLKPDLILMGKQATDNDCNQAGQMLAAKLGWPQATFAAKVESRDGAFLVTRETDSGTEDLLVPTPCVITTDLRLNEPRYIALPGIIKARSKPLEKRSRATAANPKTRVLNLQAPKSREAGRKVESVDQLVAALREKGVW